MVDQISPFKSAGAGSEEAIVTLQAGLSALGFVIDREESERRETGPSTIRAVRNFQRAHDLAFDPEWLVNAATARGLNNMLEVRTVSMVAAPVNFSVDGVVADRNGTPIPGAKLIVYDQDLRARQELGRADTDGAGHYLFNYTAEKFTRAEKGYADIVVVVVAVPGVADKTPIYTSDVAFNVPPQFTLDISLDVLGPSEFQRLELAIRPLASFGQLETYEIDDSDQFKDVSFLAGETEFSADRVADFAVAARLARTTKLDATPLYGLLRQELWPDPAFGSLPRTSGLDARTEALLSRFASVSGGSLKAALNGAVGANVVSLTAADIDIFVLAFLDYAGSTTETALQPLGLPVVSIARLAGLTPEVAKAVATAAAQAFGTTDLLASLRKNKSVPQADVNKLEGLAQFAKLALGHPVLTQAVAGQIAGLGDVRKMAAWSEAKWVELLTTEVKDSVLPAFVGGKDVVGRRSAFAGFLAARFRRAYPTMAFVGDANRDAAAGLPGAVALAELVKAAPTFDLATISIDRYLASPTVKRSMKDGDRDAIAVQLKPLQRLYKLSSDYKVTKALSHVGFRSAQEVYRRGRSQVVNLITTQTALTSRQAGAVYDSAAATSAAALQIVMEFSAMNSAAPLNAMPNTPSAQTAMGAALPNLQGLFQIGDSCACEDCNSVTSPAAYFTDITLFLENRSVGGGRSAKDVLLARRPDLVWTDLNCDNALTELPYIDICCEILEDAIAWFIATIAPIAQSDLPGASGGLISSGARAALAAADPALVVSAQATFSALLHDGRVLRDGDNTWLVQDVGATFLFTVLRNTHGSAGERSILPEYVNTAAYTKMDGMSYPWLLPLDLYGTEVRESLAQIGTPKFELMRLLKGPAAPNNPTDLDMAAARLGVSSVVAILLFTPNNTPQANWGFPSLAAAITGLTVVSDFLKASGVDYETLLQVLATSYANQGGTLSIQHLDTTCDLDKKRIVGLDGPSLDRLHRFLRLKSVLNFSVPDTAIAAGGIGAGLNTASKFVALADTLTIGDNLGGLEVSELATLVGEMPNQDMFDTLYAPLLPSFYKSLFLDPAAFPTLDPAFAVAAVTSLGPFPPIAAHRGQISAALSLKSDDLDRILALVNPATGVPFVGADLSLANLSAIFRHNRVAAALDLTIEDWCAYVRMSQANPFATPRALLDTIDRIQRAQALPLAASTLSYLLEANRSASATPPEAAIGAALYGLRISLQAIDTATDPLNLPTDHGSLAEALAPALLALDSDASRPGRVLDILEGRYVGRVTVSPTPATVPQLNGSVSDKFAFAVDDTSAPSTLMLSFQGLMPFADQAILKDPAHMGPIAIDPAYLGAIDKLYLDPRLSLRMIRTTFATPLATLPAGFSTPAPLRALLIYDPVAKTLKFQGVMSDVQLITLKGLSLDATYLAAVQVLYDQARGVVPVANVWLTDADLVFPAANESASDAETRITANIKKAITEILPLARTAEFRDATIAFAAGITMLDQDATTALLDGLSVGGAPLMGVFTDTNAFVRRTGPVTTTELQPAFQAYDLLVRCGLLGACQSLHLREVAFILSMSNACGMLGFSGLPLAFTGAATTPASLDALLAQTDLIALDASTRGKDLRLLEFLVSAQVQPATIDAAQVGQFCEAALSWPAALVTPLADTPGIGLGLPAGILSAASWRRLSQAVAVVRKLGLSTVDVFLLMAAAPNAATAALARKAMRARFGAADFPTAIKPVQTALRHMKRDALAAYLLHYVTPPAPTPSGQWKTPGDLFAYYLIDTEVNACQMTSRLVQASSTVQIFVQRAQMGLEPDISPFIAGDQHWNQWNWMGAYRLWQANYEVFLFPENVLQPDFRRDKSDAFKALENELQQNDITLGTAQDAYLNYLDRLDEVSNLDVTGVHFEDGAGQGKGAVHVIGRTPGSEPYTHYYRKLIHPEDRWTAWTKMDIDIKSASAIPFIYQHRLFAVWPDLRETKPDMPPTITPPASTSGGYAAQPSAPPNYKVGLALSENRNGVWSPKKVSTDVIEGGVLTANAQFLRTWFPLDMSSMGDGYYFVDFINDNETIQPSDTFEFLGCRGYPERSPKNLAVRKTRFARAHLFDARDEESEKGGGDDRLIASGNWMFNNTEILNLTPGNFKIAYPHHLNSYDLLGGLTAAALAAVPGAISGFKSPHRGLAPLPTGTRAPWVYGDRTRNFFVEPIALAPNGAAYNSFQMMDKIVTFEELLVPNRQVEGLILADLLITEELGFSLRWSNFYHSMVCDLRTALLTGGVPQLLARETQFLSKPFNFNVTYQPFPIVDQNNIPTEDIDFSARGAYALYNWELFFHAPFMIASKLASNLRNDDAMTWFKYIFNPAGGDGLDPVTKVPLPTGDVRRFWMTKPFFQTTSADYYAERIDQIENLLAADVSGLTPAQVQAQQQLVQQVASWRDDPFDPFLIASGRTVAFQKSTVMAFVQNLVAMGDALFLQDALEPVLEGGSIYQFAKAIMGDKPETVPSAEKPPIRCFAELGTLDAIGNVLVEVENLLPVMPPVGPPQTAPALPSLLYFCIPGNAQLGKLYDLVDDRLDKFHRCLDLNGNPRTTSLFAPKIDLTQLIGALAAGAALGDLMADLEAPLSAYRFQTNLQKANEIATDLKAFGGDLLSALEKKDGESLALLRQTHEITLLKANRTIKEQVISDAQYALANLQIAKEIATLRHQYYTSREFMNAGETTAISMTTASLALQAAAMAVDTLSGVVAAVPNFAAGASGFGGSPHVAVNTGGMNFSKAAEMAGRALNQAVGIIDKTSGMISVIAGYTRRKEDWNLQASMTAQEIGQYTAQIASAQIRIDNAKRELANQDLQIVHAQAVDSFLKTKYTNTELYSWMVNEVTKTYTASYKLAYAYAKMAEQNYRYERGIDASNIITYGYWDSLKKGLQAGGRLQFGLRQLDKAYMKANRREFELKKNISLSTLAPDALLELKRTGRCAFTIPEEVFDVDYAAHFFRRLNRMEVSIFSVVGPNTTLACTVRLVRSSMRATSELKAGAYARKRRNGVFLDDDRFRDVSVPVGVFATSTGRQDAGVFDFSGDRYLPFEGAGLAHSEWQLELQSDGALRTFDYDTISDVVMHMSYTAREDQGAFKHASIANLRAQLKDAKGTVELVRVFRVSQDFNAAWVTYRNPSPNMAPELVVTIDPARFALPAYGMTVNVSSLGVLCHLPIQMNLDVEINAPPAGAGAAGFKSMVTDNDGPDTRYQKLAPVMVSQVLAGPSDWHFHLRQTGQAAADFNPNAVDEVYLTVGYTLS